MVAGRQQSLVFRCYHPVTLAHPLFKSGTIHHGDMAAAGGNQAIRLQLAKSDGHTRTAHAQEVRNHFLGDHQLAAVQSIDTHQQPAAELLIQLMVLVADCGLRCLADQGLRVKQGQVLQAAAQREFFYS